MYKKYYAVLIVLLLIFTLTPPFSAENNSDKQNYSSAPASYGKGYRYNIMGWVYIHIEGEPYERGYQYGYLASDEIVDMMNRWSNWGYYQKILRRLNLEILIFSLFCSMLVWIIIYYAYTIIISCSSNKWFSQNLRLN